MNDSKHYYAYIYDETLNKYIGEVSYHFEEEYQEYVLNIIIEYQYRCLGKGKTAWNYYVNMLRKWFTFSL